MNVSLVLRVPRTAGFCDRKRRRGCCVSRHELRTQQARPPRGSAHQLSVMGEHAHS